MIRWKFLVSTSPLLWPNLYSKIPPPNEYSTSITNKFFIQHIWKFRFYILLRFVQLNIQPVRTFGRIFDFFFMSDINSWHVFKTFHVFRIPFSDLYVANVALRHVVILLKNWLEFLSHKWWRHYMIDRQSCILLIYKMNKTAFQIIVEYRTKYSNKILFSKLVTVYYFTCILYKITLQLFVNHNI